MTLNIIKKYHLLFIFIFIFFVFFIFATYKDYGISWDEQYYVGTGQNYLKYFFDRKTLADKIDPLHGLSHGAFFDIFYVSILRIFHQDNNFYFLHLIKALTASTTLIFIYLSVLLLTRQRIISLVAVILMIFFPRWMGDIFDNHMDAAATLLYSMQMYLAIKILYLQPKKNLSKYIGCFALISAIAFSHRTVLLFIPLIFFLIMFFKEKLHLRKMLIFFIPIFIGVYILVTPAIGLYGGQRIVKQLIYLVRYQWHNTNLFDGVFISAKSLPWYYLPKWIFITAPLFTLALFIIGIITLIGRISLAKNNEREKYAIIFILLSLFLPVFTIIVIRPVIYDGWRLFLFLSVSLIMTAALGFQTLIEVENKLAKWLIIMVFLVSILFTVSGMKKLHPYEFIYFNSLVGGIRGANGKYDTDYWGKSYKEAIEWLKINEIKKEKNYSIYSCDNTFSSEYFFSTNMKLVKDFKNADYAVCYTRWNGDQKIPGKTLFIVTREGVALNVVKKIK